MNNIYFIPYNHAYPDVSSKIRLATFRSITSKEIKEIAREHGIDKFDVKDVDNNYYMPKDFPLDIDKDLYIKSQDHKGKK